MILKLALLIAFLSISSGKTTTKEKPSATSPGTWQRSKECAEQAERVMKERGQRGLPDAGWNNHYSSKYNRCYIRTYQFLTAEGHIKGGPSASSTLLDAFERLVIATESTGLAPEIACRDEADPAECEKTARLIWEFACEIDSKPATCSKAKQFIEEHMKY